MAFKLVTTVPWDRYDKGDEITDADEIERCMADAHRHFVRVAVPDPQPAPVVVAQPAPAPGPKPIPAVIIGSDPT